MGWHEAIQQKRHQWVKGLVRARDRRDDRSEQALITLMDQLAEFEEAFRAHQNQHQNISEAEVVTLLLQEASTRWPELWATLGTSMYADTPDLWVANRHILVGVMTEPITTDTFDGVSFESRTNQLDALPLTPQAAEILKTAVDEMWQLLTAHIEHARSTLPHWEFAACMHQLGKRFLASYSKVQGEAIMAIYQAEEQGQLITIVDRETS